MWQYPFLPAVSLFYSNSYISNQQVVQPLFWQRFNLLGVTSYRGSPPLLTEFNAASRASVTCCIHSECLRDLSSFCLLAMRLPERCPRLERAALCCVSRSCAISRHCEAPEFCPIRCAKFSISNYSTGASFLQTPVLYLSLRAFIHALHLLYQPWELEFDGQDAVDDVQR